LVCSEFTEFGAAETASHGEIHRRDNIVANHGGDPIVVL
jgi:hypothetical protein